MTSVEIITVGGIVVVVWDEVWAGGAILEGGRGRKVGAGRRDVVGRSCWGHCFGARDRDAVRLRRRQSGGGGVVSTLGGGAVGVTTGEGVGGGAAGATTGRVVGSITLGGGTGEAGAGGGGVGTGVVVWEIMLLSFWMAPRRTSSGVWNGALGCGCVRVLVSMVAARVASSAGDEMGQAQL